MTLKSIPNAGGKTGYSAKTKGAINDQIMVKKANTIPYNEISFSILFLNFILNLCIVKCIKKCTEAKIVMKRYICKE
jgi:hypothetical protein